MARPSLSIAPSFGQRLADMPSSSLYDRMHVLSEAHTELTGMLEAAGARRPKTVRDRALKAFLIEMFEKDKKSIEFELNVVMAEQFSRNPDLALDEL